MTQMSTDPIKSALRESNPPVQLGKLMPLPIGQGHVLFFKAEAVGLEPTIPIHKDTCLRSRLLIRPDDIPLSSCSDRNRTINRSRWPHRPDEGGGR